MKIRDFDFSTIIIALLITKVIDFSNIKPLDILIIVLWVIDICLSIFKKDPN